ncbi:uncharacterized protein LOC131946275 [Physella acuta]|uniref:uncharacterized protein LOC131946275 n=1 Tax=Physella acuta TaxID=109671 RepID=UPI0027DABA1D|nr:uncharacterized protein LOC131946275 [Physella acuta]
MTGLSLAVFEHFIHEVRLVSVREFYRVKISNLHFVSFLVPSFIMPKTPKDKKEKRSYISYETENLEKAVDAVRQGMSYGKAALQFGVPKTTIIDHVKGRIKAGSKPGRSCEIDPALEKQIVSRVLDASKAGFPYTKRRLLAMVGNIARRLEIKTRFKNGVPGEGYWRKLKGRHPELTIRNPEALPQCRMTMLNSNVVKNYFEALGKLLDDLQLTSRPKCIWNCDETGVQLQHKPTKVVAQKGVRGVSARVTGSRENITIFATINAAGESMPPMIIVKGKTQRAVSSFNVCDAPKGAV